MRFVDRYWFTAKCENCTWFGKASTRKGLPAGWAKCPRCQCHSLRKAK